MHNVNLLRLNSIAPDVDWKPFDDGNLPEDCFGYVGTFNGNAMALALPKDPNEPFSAVVQESLKRDVLKLKRMGKGNGTIL